VLLQAEMLAAYASALVNAALLEPDGLGSIRQEVALSGKFPMPSTERTKNAEEERLLLVAVLEELLGREIAFRETGEDGTYLVFPSQLTRESADAPEVGSIKLAFEGSVVSIYATLVVRLAHSGFFATQEMSKNVATFSDNHGGKCAVHLRNVDEGAGELRIVFGDGTRPPIREQFEQFVRSDLARRAIPGSVRRSVIPACRGCGFTVTEQLLRLLAARGANNLKCPVCQTLISLGEKDEDRDGHGHLRRS
jgi:hypothetical protein